MKILSSFNTKMVGVATCAVALGACSRAQYRQLPQAAAYLGATSSEATTTPVSRTVKATAGPKTPTAAASIPDAAAAPRVSAITQLRAALPIRQATTAQLPTSSPQVKQPHKLEQRATRLVNRLSRKSEVADRQDVAVLSGTVKIGIALIVLGLLSLLLLSGSAASGALGTILILGGVMAIIFDVLDVFG